MTELAPRVRRGSHRARPQPLRALALLLSAAAVVAGGALVADVLGGPSGGDVPAGPGAARPATPTTSGEPSPSPGAAGALRESSRVVVLNQVGIPGLAAAVAEDLRGIGWDVTGTGNFSGTVPATTVYYPDGAQEAAAALAADIPGPDRTRPRFGNLSRSRLTVVLVEDVRELASAGASAAGASAAELADAAGG